MKTYGPALKAFLDNAANTQMWIADLLLIQCVNGTIIRASTSDLNNLAIAFEGRSYDWATIYNGDAAPVHKLFFAGTYRNDQVGFKRGKVVNKCGLEVGELEVTLWPVPGFTVGGISFLQAVLNGLLDGAKVCLARQYMPTPGDTSLNPVWIFDGEVSEADVERNTVHLKAASSLQQLDRKMPRNLYQASCVNTVFDAGCGLLAADFTTSSTASSSSDALHVHTSLGAATGYYNQGTLTFTSGANTGATRSVKDWSSGVATVFRAFPFPVTSGDAFYILPGCDGTYGGGCTKFSNTAQFRGFPFIPVPETVMP